MSAPNEGEVLKPRLDPFALPSQTAFRFLLLILSVAASALFAFNWIYFSLSDSAHEAAVSVRCLLSSGRLDLGTTSPDAYAQRAGRFQDCIATLTHPKGIWMIGALAAMFAVAFVVYLLIPTWYLRRRKLVALDREDAADVSDRLELLTRRAELRQTPRFVWNPLNASATGVAFGRIGRHSWRSMVA